MSPFWLETAKKLQALAQTGLFYSSNPYDRERYEQIDELCKALMNHYSEADAERIKTYFTGDDGYITPKTDIRAVVTNDDKILMVQEKADEKWSLPGGWADIGYTPYEVAVKECFEETGLVVAPVRLLAVMDKKCHPHPVSPFYSYKIFIQCAIVSGNLTAGMETLDAKFFSIDELPELSSDRITKNQIEIVLERYNNPLMEVYCE